MIGPFVLLIVFRVGLWAIGGGYYSQPSSSMEPTLPMKAAYFTLPLANDTVPERGTIAVFRKPTEPNIDYIKRIMALPGETFAMRDGVVLINGTPLPRRRVEDFRKPTVRGTPVRWCRNTTEDGACIVEQWEETLPEGRTIRILELGTMRADNVAETTVPDGHVLMLGDNRDNSVDSRFTSVGTVPIKNLRSTPWFFFIATSGDGWTTTKVFQKVDP